MAIKIKPINLALQCSSLKCNFPQGKIITSYPFLEWECELRPTPLSIAYLIKVVYSLEIYPTVYVIKPILKQSDKGRLPHTYSVQEQQICLHYPSDKHWNEGQHLSKTIIPWAAEWLYFYEIWVTTGKWKGGGTHFHDVN